MSDKIYCVTWLKIFIFIFYHSTSNNFWYTTYIFSSFFYRAKFEKNWKKICFFESVEIFLMNTRFLFKFSIFTFNKNLNLIILCLFSNNFVWKKSIGKDFWIKDLKTKYIFRSSVQYFQLYWRRVEFFYPQLWKVR